MLRVTQSNRLDALAAALADALPLGDPFARPTLVVPNRLVARWLQYELARRRGVVGALDLRFLDEYLAAALATPELRAVERPALAALVASALADPALLAEPALAPVRRYLDADDAGTGDGDDARAVRRVQLAARVAGHLWDYALTRPAWLEAWETGAPGDVGDADPATLAWQRRVYDAVRDPARALLPRLPYARARLGLPPPRFDAVHLIGFSSFARAHLDALKLLAAGGDVHVAMVTPCAEFWEDVPGRGRRARADAPDEARALVLWGAPGRDTAGMLVDAVDGDVADVFVEPAVATARDAWARDLLHRAPPPDVPRDLIDAGVTVLACPSVSRELEIVGSEIWRLLRADPALRASDVAILIAGDRDRYLAQVGPVLGGLHDLPFHLVDAPAGGAGRVAEAAALLLELPMSRFTRRAMLSLMTHPAVLARHPHVEPSDWIAWCERLGIAHGADEADHRGTYLEGAGGAFHWSQGIQRLALGAFVAGPRLGADDPVVLGGIARLPEEVAPEQQASAATFALLARSLIADARWLRSRRETLTRWGEILAAAVETYLGDVDAEADAAAGPRARVAGLLRDLAELDLDGRELPYREVVELARGRLGELRAGRGEPLAHGVLVAPIEWMRPLPFAATFVVGLGEGAFPSSDRASPLDLRTTRERGDVSPRDRDRYAFLEALLAARRHVYLSYVARDEQSGEPLAPSSVIHELAEVLAPYLGAPDAAAALDRLTVRHPLRRWDDRYLAADRDPRLTPSASPAADRERHAAALRASLDAHLRAAGRAAPPAARLRTLLAEPALAATRAALRLDLADGAPAPAADDDAPIALSLTMLRTFLESPVQAWAQVVLRIDAAAGEDDGADEEDEPFDASPLERSSLLRDTFALVLGADGPPLDVDAAYARVRRARELAGQVPLGPFGEAAARRDLARLAAWRDLLADHGALAGPWSRLAFGRSHVRGAALRPPIALSVRIGDSLRRVELFGTTELVGGADLRRSLVLVHKDVREGHRLRCAIDHLALAAAGELDGAPREALVLHGKLDVRPLAPWTPEEARAHLSLLAGELLGAPHAYLLPFDAAKGVITGDGLGKVEGKEPHPLGFGPLDRNPGLDAPPDAEAIARRRLGPILERMPAPARGRARRSS